MHCTNGFRGLWQCNGCLERTHKQLTRVCTVLGSYRLKNTSLSAMGCVARSTTACRRPRPKSACQQPLLSIEQTCKICLYMS